MLSGDHLNMQGGHGLPGATFGGRPLSFLNSRVKLLMMLTLLLKIKKTRKMILVTYLSRYPSNEELILTC